MDSIFNSLHPSFFRIAEQLPVIDRWVSPIPFIEDLSLEDYQELKTAATPPPQGLKAAVAVAKANPLFPQFYVASHFATDDRWVLHIQGISDTLLNQISFQDKFRSTCLKNYLKQNLFI